MDKFPNGQYRGWYDLVLTCRKKLLITKLTLVFVLIFSLSLQASVLAQKLTISKKDISLEQLFNEIKEQTDYRFIFEENLLTGFEKISLNLRDVTLEELLTEAFRNQNLSFQIHDGTVVVKRLRTKFLQQKVSGTVKDEKNQPFAGVSIRVVGKNLYAVSNEQGAFEINAAKGDSLRFSFVGYKTETLVVQENLLNLSMQLDENKDLDEVVVVGYQQQSLRKTTSAVQIVSGKQIENLPAPSFEALLQGRVAGVNIQNFSGAPGVRNTFTVRGNSTISSGFNTEDFDLARTMSTPLYIIDGIPLTITDLEGSSTTGTNFLAGINVNDIESIVVQKDAAATAVWGSRGANGVVVINTKKGATGKPQVRLSAYAGVSQRPELQRTYAGAEERRLKMRLLEEYGSHNQLQNIPQMLTDSLNPSYNNATDWQELFYQTGLVQNYDVNISSGNEVLNYRLSFNHYNEDGIIRNTGFKRYAMRGNFDFKISPKLNSNLVISASRTDRKRGLGRSRGLVDENLPINPTQLPSSFVRLGQNDYDFYYGLYDRLRDKNITDAFSLYSQTNIKLLKGLEYSFQGSISANIDNRDRFFPAELDANGVSNAFSNASRYSSYYLANVLTYTNSWSNTHNLVFTGMQSFQYDARNSTYVGGNNVPTDDIQVVTGIAQRDLFGNSNFGEAGLLSYMGQLAYDYKGKYLLSASWRADASSRFGANTKWGYFPAASLGWLVSEETFMKDVNWINLFKFRASYGLSGTLPDNFYAPFNVWDVTTETYDGITMATPSFANPITQPDLTWNKSRQLNVGADMYLLSNRLNITVDAYRKETINPIMGFPYPFYTGFTTLTYNVPLNILNEGVDLLIQTRNLPSSSALQWNTNFNLSYNRNRLASLPQGNRGFFTSSQGYNQQLLFNVGSPVYTWGQMVYEGVYSHLGEIPINPLTGEKLTYWTGNRQVIPGDPIWQDVNGDYDVWDRQDLQPTGDPNPTFTGGLYNEFSYKNFSISALFTFTLGRDIINNFMANQYAGVWNYGNINSYANRRLPDFDGINYWTPSRAENPDYQADFPSLNPYGNSYYQFLPFSTMWNENGNFVRLKMVSLGYNFKPQLLSRLGLKNARVYSMIDNLFILQSSSVPDAELVTPQGEYSGGAYPLPKKYTIGLEVTF
ncbi:SusC/RagA family TonB-linked outer membrane protein [Olivibacter sp. XZL3]|uniref:SusC/RagA family TonB-linked outer membrane protein n=1 Tax=Olivibacter sp. XZL3 TaxID=1735116 RepID=UPI001065E94F|nr:SusC/RagA family TonB-linked outer membrane protein [Olivibacter sp. XZL3]